LMLIFAVSSVAADRRQPVPVPAVQPTVAGAVDAANPFAAPEAVLDETPALFSMEIALVCAFVYGPIGGGLVAAANWVALGRTARAVAMACAGVLVYVAIGALYAVAGDFSGCVVLSLWAVGFFGVMADQSRLPREGTRLRAYGYAIFLAMAAYVGLLVLGATIGLVAGLVVVLLRG
jgi:hypothetical protein